MSATCARCGKQGLPNATFCHHCGLAFGATSAEGRTVVNASLGGPLSQSVRRTVAQRAEQSFGSGPTFVRAALTAKGDPNQRELTVIVNDVSGSMDEKFDGSAKKIEAAIRASVNMVLNKEQIDSKDEIALVTFNSAAQLLMDLHPIYSHKGEVIRTLQSLTPDDGTDINEGLIAGGNALDWSRPNVVRRIVLLTDGQGGEPLRTAQDLKDRGVVIDIIGIGDTPANVNEPLLKKVASTVAGELRYRFIKDHQSLIAHYTHLADKTATRP